MNQTTSSPLSIQSISSLFSKKIIWILGIILVLLWVISTYNGLVFVRQAVDTAWAQVQTDYQRRLDLTGQLVAVVSGSANFEKSTLEAVVNARAKATSITVNAGDDASIQKYLQAQDQLQGSLSRLMAVAENYPALRTTEAFMGLQSQVECTENRIAVARKDFNKAVGNYNGHIVRFPQVIVAKIFGFTPRSAFEASAGAQNAPTIDFGEFSKKPAESAIEAPVSTTPRTMPPFEASPINPDKMPIN